MISEGSCSIFNEGNVFYNPVQQFNRDLSISVLSTYSYLVQKFGTTKKSFDLKVGIYFGSKSSNEILIHSPYRTCPGSKKSSSNS